MNESDTPSTGGIGPAETGGTAVAEQVEEKPAPRPRPEAKFGYWWGTGRRKAAVARVRIRPGEGQFQINRRGVEDFFTEIQDREDMEAPLKATDTLGKIDVFVNVHGGGRTGQAGAIRLGLARALKTYDPELEAALRDAGYLTVDARRVERKKYGQPGARKRFQFSKR